MSTNSSLSNIIQKIKEDISKETNSSNIPQKQDEIKPINKKPISNSELITSIDDYDKNEWINLRTSYANKLYFLLVGEIIGLFILVICVGLKKLEISDSTINITIVSVLSQTFLLVREIVTNLFKKNS